MVYEEAPQRESVLNVGVRDLRDNLSRHLASVREGNTVTVTDHGRPVARIVPIDDRDTYDRLVAEGRITPARRPKRPAPQPHRASGTVSDLVAEQRR